MKLKLRRNKKILDLTENKSALKIMCKNRRLREESKKAKALLK